MATVTDHINDAITVLNSIRFRDSHTVTDHNLRKADIHANLATATALDSIAQSLTAIAHHLNAGQELPAGITLQPAIGHNA